MSERFDYSCFDNSFTTRPESHIAQQRRRDKLRVSQSVTPTGYNIHDLPYHLIQSELNPDLVQVRGIRNCDLLYDQDQAMISSDMLNFSMNTHVFLGQKDAVLQQEPGGAQSSRAIVPDDVSFSTLSKVAGPQNPCHWKGIGSQQSGDWMVSFVNGAGGNACSQAPLFVGEPLIDNPKEAILSKYTSPGCNGYQDVGQSSLTNSASSKQYGELNFSSPVVYQNALQEVVTSSSRGTQGYEMTSLAQQSNREFGHSAWLDGGNKQMVVPTYGNEVSVARLNNGDSWFHRILEGTSTQGNSELGIENGRNARHHDRVVGETTSRSLSLSLSSHSPLNVVQIGERFVSENLQPRTNICSGSQDSKLDNAGYLCPGSKPSIISTSQGNSLQGIAVSSGCTRRSIGPLGPFTGYATILKNSKFLKPAQQLLDEICSCKLIKACGSSERCSREVGTSSEPFLGDNETGRRGGSSEVSSSFNSSSQAGGLGSLGCGFSQTYISEFQQKKAKLMYMEEEVCRRYKQYHQQMQMVVSSFESVAGLSSATPYTSLALKAVTKHFQSLKNAISDQISYITKGSSENFLSTVTGTSKGDSMMSNIRCIDQKQAGMDRIRIFERQVPQHPIWKPQRGLPERAVAILRSWLFDHFLHPYPTDTDKHMLANQTGLSRNQVSNWFINARVRVWKPMVEEMHMLETKVSSETDHESGNTQAPGNDGNVGCSGDQSSNKLMIDAMSEKSPKCSAVQLVPGDVEETSEQWAQEKRCRVERHIPQSMDGNLMGFVPYHGGIGAISLTLGLRHSSDQQQQHEHQLRRHYGGQMVYDFVG